MANELVLMKPLSFELLYWHTLKSAIPGRGPFLIIAPREAGGPRGAFLFLVRALIRRRAEEAGLKSG